MLNGLRKLCAKRLADAGCTTHQIAAITGHKTLAEIQRYTIEAEQKKLVQAAIARLLLPTENVENAWKTGKTPEENAVSSET